MKKTVIIYASTHHGNTRKLIEAISEKYQIDIIDAIEQKFANLSEYDLIGFASGSNETTCAANGRIRLPRVQYLWGMESDRRYE